MKHDITTAMLITMIVAIAGITCMIVVNSFWDMLEQKSRWKRGIVHDHEKYSQEYIDWALKNKEKT